LKSPYFILLLFYLIGCSSNPKDVDIEVKHAGALKNFMHKGDISAKASLDTLNPVDLYALGALENLKGEFIVVDGEPYLSREVNGELLIEKTYEARVSLLVYSYVSNWKDQEIKESVSSYRELEILVEEAATKFGIDVETPFPFLIKGKINSFGWHVINWPENDTMHTHLRHIESGLNGVEENRDITILGFYSRLHQSIFTHHTTHMHLHVLTKEKDLVGHVDEIIPGTDFKLLFPAAQ